MSPTVFRKLWGLVRGSTRPARQSLTVDPRPFPAPLRHCYQSLGSMEQLAVARCRPWTRYRKTEGLVWAPAVVDSDTPRARQPKASPNRDLILCVTLLVPQGFAVPLVDSVLPTHRILIVSFFRHRPVGSVCVA